MAVELAEKVARKLAAASLGSKSRSHAADAVEAHREGVRQLALVPVDADLAASLGKRKSGKSYGTTPEVEVGALTL